MQENNIDALFTGKLIVGDQDSLILFGSEPQARLRELSKGLSDIVLRENGELEILISEMVVEIDDFQKRNEKTSVTGLWRTPEKKRSSLIARYNEILVYIDKMMVALQLQEAQLLKDNNLLNTMENKISEGCTDLKECIEEGERILDNYDRTVCAVDGMDETMAITWRDRLVRKIDDLSVTHTVSIQTLAQIKLMRNNNLQLIDKIVATISGTIPIWRNQVSLLLGMEKLNQNHEVQKKVAEITEQFVNRNAKTLRKCIKKRSLSSMDEEHLTAANLQMKKTLGELSDMEKADRNIRKDLGSKLI